jgi:Mrp family chromosome partitioning ATPase
MSESLQRAAAVKLPPVLELPEVFQTPDEEPLEQQAESGPEVFAPEWEVDRFAWPPICQALLEAQASYFQHVGSRLLAATEESSHVIMIGGSRRSEGRTTLALCLARCAAQVGVPVALVDADYQNPQLGALLRMEIPCSWLETVQRRAPLQEAAVSSIEDRLTLFGLTYAESGSTAGDHAQLVKLLESVSKHYPLVIVDAGPLDSEGGRLFAEQTVCPIDTAIVVRDLRNTAFESALGAARRLQQSGIQAVGIAENFLMAE